MLEAEGGKRSKKDQAGSLVKKYQKDAPLSSSLGDARKAALEDLTKMRQKGTSLVSHFRQGGQGQGTAGGEALLAGREEFRVAACAELGIDNFADAQGS
jgi:hypothetical protein